MIAFTAESGLNTRILSNSLFLANFTVYGIALASASLAENKFNREKEKREIHWVGLGLLEHGE